MRSQREVYNRRKLADLIREVADLWGEDDISCYVDEQLKLWSNTLDKQYQAFACFQDLIKQREVMTVKFGRDEIK